MDTAAEMWATLAMLRYALVPVVAALIGWGTNLLAIRLLFRPHKPLVLGPVVIQGLIPKRRNEIARALAATVSGQLLKMDELFTAALTPELQEEICARVLVLVEERGKSRLPVFLPEGIRNMIMEYVRKAVAEEIHDHLPSLTGQFAGMLKDNIDVEKIIIDRLDAMDLMQLEELIVSLAKKELKAIEYVGGILGFIIGLLQVLLLLVF